MTVHFIGAGPGAPDLLTLRGRDLIRASGLIVYAGSLIPTELLAHAPAEARTLDTQNLTLDQIVDAIAAAHADGHDVARLQSGDLSIYSALAEQTRRLDDLGIPWDVTPGVPAFAAASAAIGRELTLPEVAQTVILTRYQRRSTAMPEGEDLASLAAHRTTLVLHLAVHAVAELVPKLLESYPADCPVAVVARASWPDEAILWATLGSLAEFVERAGIRRTAIIVVSPALAANTSGESHLYSAERTR